MDALALRADEGRGKQRNCSGELQASFDPEISEWGNLAPIMRRRRRMKPQLRHSASDGKRAN